MTRDGETYRSVGLSDLGEVARDIAGLTDKYNIFLFHGEVGAGKTTLIKEVCTAMGVRDAMSSPTFAIVNEYRINDNKKVYHFDFYRIRTEAEAYDIGVDEYFYSGFPCFVEWPEKIPSIIPAIFAEVTLQIENNSQRTIAISVHDGKKENRV